MICVVECSKWQREFLGSFDSGVIRQRAGRINQNVVSKLFMIGQLEALGMKIYMRDSAADELCLIIKQFPSIGRDVPGFHFAAQILIEHRLEEEVIFVVDEGDIAGAIQVEGSE